MIDVVRNDCAAACDLVTHEFRSDDGRQAGAERLAGMLPAQRIGELGRALVRTLIFTNGDELHLGRHQSTTRVVHLADVRTGSSAARLAMQVEAQLRELRVVEALHTKSG